MVTRGGSGVEDANDVAFSIVAGLSVSCNADVALSSHVIIIIIIIISRSKSEKGEESDRRAAAVNADRMSSLALAILLRQAALQSPGTAM